MKQVNILVYENDNSARRDIVNLIIRDRRARLVAAVESKELLFTALRDERCKPDAILIDLEYRRTPRPIELIEQIHQLRKYIPVICISEYGDSDGDLICQAIEAGAVGYIDKNDISVMYVTAVLQALKTNFVYSNAVEKAIEAQFPELIQEKHRIETWRLHPEIPPRHVHVVHECILYGLPIPLVASQLTHSNGRPILAQSSVTTYVRDAYEVLKDHIQFYDRTYLERYWGKLGTSKEIAFHMMTQPPSREHPAFDPNAVPQLYANYDNFSA